MKYYIVTVKTAHGAVIRKYVEAESYAPKTGNFFTETAREVTKEEFSRITGKKFKKLC